MKFEDVERMAEQADIDPYDMCEDHRIGVHRLMAFAKLVLAAERDACAKVCEDKSMHCEKKAQEAIEAGEHDEVSAIRSTAWQISVCAAAIRARSDA